MTTEIKIEDLSKSKLNARKTLNKEALSELKASLLSHGLLQNLVVVQKGDEFEVIAGARRLEALKELLKEGAIKRDYLVRCEVVTPDRALEMSVAENTVRQQMHPADEFEAYAALINKNNSVRDVAERFGVTEKHVTQRLKMGHVHPDLIKLYRDGKMDLESVMAFTLTDDQKQQLAIYKSCKTWERDNAYRIKEKIMSKAVSPRDNLVKFVGADAYEKAGGKIVKDLFSEDVYFNDSALLNKLAVAKLDAEVEKIKKEGFAWVEASLKHDHEFTWGCDEAPYKTKEQKAKCGCYVSIDYTGKLTIERGLVKRKKKSAVKGSTTAPEKKKEGFSEALRQSLSEYRLQAIQAEIIDAPDTAMDMLAFFVASALNGDTGVSGCDVHFNRLKRYYVMPEDMKKTVAANKLTEARKSLDFSWAKAKTEAERFQVFVKLPLVEKIKIMAFAFAQTLEPDLRNPKDNNFIETALTSIECDIAKYWRPTQDNFFGRIHTDDLIKIGKEIFGAKWEPATGGKGAIAKQLHEAFADPKKSAAGNIELQQRIENWLPVGMEVADSIPTKQRKVA